MRIAAVLILAASFPCFGATVRGAGGRYLATAYDQRGDTKSGVPVEQHIVAADPAFLPLGSKIKIRGAGRYSGEYVVADTGEKIVGRHLDIFIPNMRACTKFGKKTVRVRVISLGNDTKENVKQAVQDVKQDVKQDLKKGAVGNAATEADWSAHPAAAAAAEKGGGSTAGGGAAAADTAAPAPAAK